MTRWGLVLLAVYLALALRKTEQEKATRYAVWTTVVVVGVVALKMGAL